MRKSQGERNVMNPRKKNLSTLMRKKRKYKKSSREEEEREKKRKESETRYGGGSSANGRGKCYRNKREQGECGWK